MNVHTAHLRLGDACDFLNFTVTLHCCMYSHQSYLSDSLFLVMLRRSP